MSAPKPKLETDVLRETLLALGQRDDVLIWRQNTAAGEFGGPKQSEMLSLLQLLTDSSFPIAKRVNVVAATIRSMLNRKTRFVHVGLKGQADATGILKVGKVGVRLEVETKSETGRLTKEQTDFSNMVRGFGGVYIVARSASEAMRLVDEAKGELERVHGMG